MLVLIGCIIRQLGSMAIYDVHLWWTTCFSLMLLFEAALLHISLDTDIRQ